jgi:hypothetical protein
MAVISVQGPVCDNELEEVEGIDTIIRQRCQTELEV